MNTPIQRDGEAVPAKTRKTVEAPLIDVDLLTIPQMCRLYRILDNIEETANMAHQYVSHVDGQNPVTKYMDELQEYLSAERFWIIEALRDRKANDGRDGEARLATIMQYEPWCGEFSISTVGEFVVSTLSREAV